VNRQERIEAALQSSLAPEYLDVCDESGGHNVPEGSESHFRVTVVSEEFAGKPELARHRMVYQALREELARGLHALALHTRSPQEWRAGEQQAPQSPPCRGGGD